MNEETLRKLAKNPHYTMSAKQRAEYNELMRKDSERMQPMGKPVEHNNRFETHETRPKKARK